MYWFTADEHAGHDKPFIVQARGFTSVDEHDSELIRRHNERVSKGDIVVHVGDFTLKNAAFAADIIRQLNGEHIFIKGSHDYWLKNGHEIWEKKIGDTYVVACHYAFRVWSRSHYGSLLAFGHSHGRLPEWPGSWDVGVDNNDLYPVSLDELKEKIENIGKVCVV